MTLSARAALPCFGLLLISVCHCGRAPSVPGEPPPATADAAGPTVPAGEPPIESHASEPVRLLEQGNANFNAGNFLQAKKDYESALELAIRVGDRPLQARILNNLAALHDRQGELSAARDLYEYALETLDGTVGSEKALVRALLGLENLELIEGNFDEAHRLLVRVREILQQAPEAGRLGILLSELGWLELIRNRPKDALDHLLEAFAELEALRPEEQIRLWHRLGSTLSELKWTAESLLAYQEGLKLARSTGWAEPELLSALCELFLDFPTRDLPDHCPEALARFESAIDPNRNVGHYWQQARYLERKGLWEEALKASGRSVDYLDRLRLSIKGRNRRERFLTDRSTFFRYRIGLLIAAHQRSPAAAFDIQALEASERLRARSLLELWAESDFDFLASAAPELRAEFEKKLSQLRDLEAHRGDQATEEKIASLLESLDILDQKLRESSPFYRQLPSRAPSPPAALQALLEDDTAALDLILNETESYLFILEKHRLRTFVLPAGAEIEAAAARYLDLLSDSDAVGSRAALFNAGTHLARLLWGDEEERLDGLPAKLYFLGDGALQPFPWAALPRLTGNSERPQWLIESHEVVHLPSLSLLDALSASKAGPRPSRDAILVGDPLYHLESKTGSGLHPLGPDEVSRLYPQLSPPPKLGRLRFADLEATRLAARFGNGAIEVATGPHASRKRVLAPDIEDFSIVHLVSHGYLDSEHVELSALLLTEIDEAGASVDGHLRLQDLYGLKLRADLVVASACQTGVGGGARLEGVNGLTQGFFHAGARRALVSLWQVESESTAHLMDHFYEHLLAGKAPGAALRLASLRLMQDADRQNRNWSAPFFWAPFILVGDAEPFQLPSEKKH